MERSIEADTVILICESYTLESRYLHNSLMLAGYDVFTVILEENDFLPKGVTSVYDLLSGNFKQDREKRETPKFFNEISVPDSWSISAGVDEPNGKITYQGEEKGRIYYTTPVKKYLVKEVDWLDRKGNVSFREHYNRYGDICARTIYGIDGRRFSKSWFSPDNREILVENYVTGDFIFNDGNRVKHFRSKTDLISYYFTRLGFGKRQVFFNSLSTPFFLSERLPKEAKQDILFWHEPIGESIPGNMQLILNGKSGRIDKIVVQKKKVYDKLLTLGTKPEMLYRLGFLYPFEKENSHKPEALICTDSDRLEHCRELFEAFPGMKFHIVAITVVSEKLKSLGDYENVSVYPAAKENLLEELFKKCDYYFDINHYAEIITAVHRAFLNNHLIFAFQETVHNRDYVADEHIYPILEFERLVSDVRAVMADEAILEKYLEKQRAHALSDTKEDYIRVVGK